MKRSWDVIVLGAGIAGLGVARALVLQGKKVLVLNKKVEGASSPHASGILDPFVDLDARPELLTLTLRALQKYPRWIRQIEKETGLRTGFEKIPLIYVAFNSREKKKLENFLRVVRAYQKTDGKWLTRAEILSREPEVSKEVLGGLCLPSVARVFPRRLLQSLRVWLIRKGVVFKTVSQNGRLLTQNGKTVGICLGSRSFKAGCVVNCTGAWAGLLNPSSGLRLPVEPVRGQIAVYRCRKSLKVLLHSVNGGYLIPWGKSQVLAGSTAEKAGFQARVTPGGLKKIALEGAKLLPELKKARPIKTWAGLRPRSLSGVPQIGKTGVSGYYVANGYYRFGILISIYAGELLAGMIQSGKTPGLLKSFSPK